MDFEDKLWTACWVLLATVVMVLGAFFLTNSAIKSGNVSALIASGVNPLSARCAVYGSDERLDCNILLAK